MTAAVQPGGAAADRFGGRLRVAAADRPFVIALLAALAAFLLSLPAWLLDGALALLISFSAFVLMAALFAPRPQDFAGFPALLRNAALAQLCLNLATTRGIVLQAGQGPDAAGRIVAAFDGFLSGSGLVVGLAIGVLLMTTLFLIARAGKVRDKIGGTPEKLLVAAGLGVPLLAALDLVGGGLLLAARSGLPLPAVVPDTARLATADGLALLLPLLLLALALVAMDRKLRRVTAPTIATPATAISAAGDPATAAAAAEAPSPLAEALRVDPVRLELGFGLLDLLDENGAAALGKRIEALRRQLAADKGIVLPALRIRENLQLPTFGYRFCIREIEAVQGRLRPQKLRICDPRGRAVELPGEPAEAPDGGLPTKWCEPALQADADRLGYRVATPLDVIAEQLAAVSLDHLPELLGYNETRALLAGLAERERQLVADLVPARLSLGRLQRVLQHLLAEQVSIRDLPAILEALADATCPAIATAGQNAADLAEIVRSRLARQITHAACDAEGRLPVVALSPHWQERLTACLTVDANDRGDSRRLALDDEVRAQFVAALGKALDRQALQGEAPVLLTGPALRRPLRVLLEGWRPETLVLSEREIAPKTPIRRLEVV